MSVGTSIRSKNSSIGASNGSSYCNAGVNASVHSVGIVESIVVVMMVELVSLILAAVVVVKVALLSFIVIASSW
ncbi:Hypothetical predicted protein [Octopus vulgaris]|uniref:Transmembrane protein n=1 Tax=Octopus vulgaris TaxID=6645 RepID=A0AA36BBS8_OCTVU|nr:Hypothetical predicted protein [Octopus vulgaris]